MSEQAGISVRFPVFRIIFPSLFHNRFLVALFAPAQGNPFPGKFLFGKASFYIRHFFPVDGNAALFHRAARFGTGSRQPCFHQQPQDIDAAVCQVFFRQPYRRDLGICPANSAFAPAWALSASSLP